MCRWVSPRWHIDLEECGKDGAAHNLVFPKRGTAEDAGIPSDGEIFGVIEFLYEHLAEPPRPQFHIATMQHTHYSFHMIWNHATESSTAPSMCAGKLLKSCGMLGTAQDGRAGTSQGAQATALIDRAGHYASLSIDIVRQLLPPHN